MVGPMPAPSRALLFSLTAVTGTLLWTAPASADGLEELYLPADFRGLEVQGIVEAATHSGAFASAQDTLTRLAAEWKAGGDQSSWLEAQTAWLELEMVDDPSADAGEALADLASQAREWGGHQRIEAHIYQLWADMLERQGDWISATRAQDSASQAALDGGWINTGTKALLEMARMARLNNHPWRLQQAWTRIDQILAAYPDRLDIATRESVRSAREISAPLLKYLGALAGAGPAVQMEPSLCTVQVSSSDGEVARGRFLLTNATARTVSGTLKVHSAGDKVTSWSGSQPAHTVTLVPEREKSAQIPAGRQVRLRPGEQLPVFIERDGSAGAAKVSLSWASAEAAADSTLRAISTRDAALSAMTGSSRVTQHAGWTQPLYHEINYRGKSSLLKDFSFTATQPCRLEVFDLDDPPPGGALIHAGRLLCIDADGDGRFDGPDDFLSADRNHNQQPDMAVGQLSRGLECHVFPLTPGQTNVNTTLRTGSKWSPMGADEVVQASKASAASRSAEAR